MRITFAPLHRTDNITAQLHLFRNEETSAYPHPIHIDILILNANSTIDFVKNEELISFSSLHSLGRPSHPPKNDVQRSAHPVFQYLRMLTIGAPNNCWLSPALHN